MGLTKDDILPLARAISAAVVILYDAGFIYCADMNPMNVMYKKDSKHATLVDLEMLQRKSDDWEACEDLACALGGLAYDVKCASDDVKCASDEEEKCAAESALREAEAAYFSEALANAKEADCSQCKGKGKKGVSYQWATVPSCIFKLMKRCE